MMSDRDWSTAYLDLRDTIQRWLTGELKLDAQDAEDVFSEGMVKLRSRYNPKRGRPINLMVSICKHLVYDRCKHCRRAADRSHMIPSPSEDQNQLDMIIDNQERSEVRRVLLLGLRGQEYLVRRLWIEEYSVDDIGETTGMHPNRVRSLLRRSR